MNGTITLTNVERLQIIVLLRRAELGYGGEDDRERAKCGALARKIYGSLMDCKDVVLSPAAMHHDEDGTPIMAPLEEMGWPLR